MLDPKKLTSEMKKKGYTNKSIAEAVSNMGVPLTKSALSGYRLGEYNPRLEVLSCLAKILSVKEQDLLK